jgi:hypothetical protein
MAIEKFSIIALEETSYWADGLLEEHGIEGAFGLYLIRHGEATHICSFTPNSWCYWIRNEFVYDSDNEAAHEFADDHQSEGGQSDYFGFMDPETMDPRFIAETFTVDVPDDLTPEGRETAEYHEAIWEQAQEAAHEFDCNGLWAKITGLYEYRQYQREQALKRQGENRPVLAQGYHAEFLPLFYAAADAMGVKTYEQATAIGWL